MKVKLKAKLKAGSLGWVVRVSVAALSLSSASCAPSTQTQLVIRVDAMDIPGNGLGVRIVVRRMGAMAPIVDRMVMDPRFPLEIGIVAAETTAVHGVEIELRASPRDFGMLVQRASANFVPNRVMYVNLAFTAACTVVRDEECRRQGLACRSDGQCLPSVVPMGEIFADGRRTMMRMEPPARSDAGDAMAPRDGSDASDGTVQNASDTGVFDAPESDALDATLTDNAAVSDGDI